MPDESAGAIRIERTISKVQGDDFAKQEARLIGATQQLAGFQIQSIIDRLSRVTERPSLRYNAWLYNDSDPNAAALADGRIYISTGLLRYLAGRGSRSDELAFILGHELAHTVAQHLVKRYRLLQQQQLAMAILAAGASAVIQNAGSGIQQAGKLALDAASLLQDVANSGYSQQDELEADQLGIRYVIRAGFNPKAALDLLEDFERFDTPSPFLRTHPYIARRRADLQRYLTETGQLDDGQATAPPIRTGNVQQDGQREERIKDLREAQKLYPAGSVSWKNLQTEINRLEGKP